MSSKLFCDNTFEGGRAAVIPPPSRSSKGTPASSESKGKHRVAVMPRASSKRARVSPLDTLSSGSARPFATPPP
ncbi:UNVERIFIED_CONTAM: hypothetical protein Sradi_4125000 [Sesamum radiatum]|uniref:Uncharacterized protein n=1 Tax=Sesamum radiatum TaxID=300843 RepID=A0AAW2P332_SESRA